MNLLTYLLTYFSRRVQATDMALEDAILVSLAIRGLGSGGRLGCGSLGEEPCVTECRRCLVPSVRRKAFERDLLNKLRQATHIHT